MCRYQIISGDINLSHKKENKMSAILIQLQNVLPKSSSAKMISSDIALVQNNISYGSYRGRHVDISIL